MLSCIIDEAGVSDEIGNNRMEATNARLARGDQFFWALVTLAVVGFGVTRMAGVKLREDEIPQLTFAHPDELPKRSFAIDHTPTASIRR